MTCDNAFFTKMKQKLHVYRVSQALMIM